MTSSREIEHAAAAWLARRDAGDWSERDQQQLDAWLDASVGHRVAFVRLDAAWRQSDRLKALGAGVPAGVVPARGSWAPSPFGAPHDHAGESHHPRPGHIQVDASRRIARRHRGQRRSLFRHLATAAMLALLVSLALVWRHYGAVEQVSYRTAIGDLQEVPLADGSIATLSSDSRLVVTLSRGERHVDLQQGEAFFAVAKDPSRPFVVSAGGRRVTAVGTRFAVRRDAADLRVVVTEGLVRLESDRRPNGLRQPATLLPAGSVALASDTGVVVHAGSVQRAEEYLSWRSGFVNFHDTPLAAAAAEFNRYNTRKIVIGDASVGTMRVGGNFRWSNVDAFVRLLAQGFPIQARQQGDSIVLTRR
ncbi:FecR domain-containing protein [Rhodanobacter sp. KK11]|uniref:FecR family protein n=1 Tax=Rhodanobacter sp. KK11 TaxID=3083255 RepID=UPI002967369B|nr:FecR domain-containing protein [Rhodanobacter sp. KK11]MDW2980636.1 FecR domain-containing protein [Rhodanobacter sp. KK11]